MNNSNTLLQPVLNITGNKIVLYYEFMGQRKHTTVKTEVKHTPSLIMSDSTTKTIRQKIELWTDVIQNVLKKKPQQTFTFITLTLPAVQKHSDREIHKALNRYLDFTQRKHGKFNYLWVAERQKNLNIHYHILTDTAINWQEVRRLWNKEMKKLGYIDAYREQQIKWHSNGNKQGFKYRQQTTDSNKHTTNKHWTLCKQYKAYQEGVKTNWSNPNTTDIHKLHNVKNIQAYLTKYITKASHKQQLKQCNTSTDRNDYIKKHLKESIINGNKWNASKAVKQLQQAKYYGDSNTEQIVKQLIELNKGKHYRNDHCIIVDTTEKQLLQVSPDVQKILTEQRKKNAQMLYKSQENTIFDTCTER